jgi:hypothetical protein
MAAGLGFKDFTTGEVLTAADVDGYLMQGVLVFASSAARDAAITSPQEGQFAFLKDTNTTMYYTGSAWTNLDTTGLVNPMTTTGDMIYSSPGSTPVRLAIGSAGQVLTVASGIPSWATAAGGSPTYAVFRDEKTSGTAGGTFTSGAQRTRDINATQSNNITGASIATNQITLAAGTYYVEISAPAFAVATHQARLQNITDATTAILGQISYTDSGDSVVTHALVTGVFTIAASKTFEVQHICATTKASNGFGVPGAFSTEVYTNISIAKIG